MNKITVFNFVSMDGYFAGPRGEIDWFKSMKPDREFDRYSQGNAQGKSILAFGRKTYEMMKSYWPTEAAIKSEPEMAKALDFSPKMVFSRKLKKVEESENWKNITLFNRIDAASVRGFIKRGKKDVTILGSGSIIAQFADLGLIDEYTMVVVPVALGAGKSMFEGAKKAEMKLLSARPFGNGVVVLKYKARK